MMFILAPDISTTETEYGIVILDHKSGKYWNLNPTGALVLRSMLDTGNLDDAVNALAQAYEVDLDMARSDAQNVANGLIEATILIAADGGGK